MASNQIVSTLTDGGRVVIPSEYRKALGINVGDEVVMFLSGDEIRLLPRKVALKKAQELVKKYAGNRSLTEELIKERRQESEGE
jgi:AbrB family looped-hinge helix DNA binding protein